nr:uncharacterized protein LOC129446564 isoform X1 [Misgurnus anguillicaudatus]
MVKVQCPLCRKLIANMRQHLRLTHGVVILRERQLWVLFSRRKVTKPFHPCPLCGRTLKHIRPHFANSHRELSAKELRRAVRQFQWEVTMERLRDLQASRPDVPLVTLGEPSEAPEDEGIPSAPTPSITPAVSFTPAPSVSSPHPIINSPPMSPHSSAVVEEIAVELKQFLISMDIPGMLSESVPGSGLSSPDLGMAISNFLSRPRDNALCGPLSFLLIQKCNVCFITVTLDGDAEARAGIEQVSEWDAPAFVPETIGFVQLLEMDSMDGEMVLGPGSPTLEAI